MNLRTNEQQIVVAIEGAEPYLVDPTRDKLTIHLSMTNGNGAWLNGRRLEPGTRVYQGDDLIHCEPMRCFAYQGREPLL